MGLMQDTGGRTTAQMSSITGVDDTAILLDERVNKYNPGFQIFKLQSLGGLQPNSKTVTTQYLNLSNLRNKHPEELGYNPISRMACVRLWLPITVSRTYPHAKFIPYGTMFTVSFVGGDISKPPVILRGIWDDEEEVQAKRNSYYTEDGGGLLGQIGNAIGSALS